MARNDTITLWRCPDHPHVVWTDEPEDGYTYCFQCDRDRTEDAMPGAYVAVEEAGSWVVSVPPYAIGAGEWPGLAKLAEECGELMQVIGKLMAYPAGDHPDGGPPLVHRLHDELADVTAAAAFVIEANQLNQVYAADRMTRKVERFRGWHEDEQTIASKGTEKT